MERDTFLQRLDPGIKIIGLCILFLTSVLLSNIYCLFILLCLLFFLIIHAGGLQNLLHLKWLVLVISVMCILFWLPTKTFIYGAIVALRLDIMLFAGILFISCSRIEAFSAGLTKLGLPYRIAFAVSLAFRLIPSLFSIIQTTVEAQQTRGLNVKEGHILKRAKKYIPLFIPVISQLVRDAHHLSMALESKGFGFKNKRTDYCEYSVEAGDYIALVLLFLLLLLSIIVR